MVQLKFFGDDRDYFKYDLITSIFTAGLFKKYVFIPMLTEQRKDTQGRIVPKYNGDKSLKLFNFISTCHTKSLNHWETWLTPYVVSYQTVQSVDETYFRNERRTDYWERFKPLMGTAEALVFVDPDTGLQTGTPKYQKKMGPEKYVLGDELNVLFRSLHNSSALMIYQHLPRDKKEHASSVYKKLRQVQSFCGTDLTCAYRENDLAFVFVVKSEEIFNPLLLFLNTYFEKSMQLYKTIMQLRCESLQSMCESIRPSNDKRMMEYKIPVKCNADGVIVNAGALTAQEVVNQRVLCPGCCKKVFKRWPLGWDTHSAYQCSGAFGDSDEQKKTYFRHRFAHLFRM
jgi:hypothetical protein